MPTLIFDYENIDKIMGVSGFKNYLETRHFGEKFSDGTSGKYIPPKIPPRIMYGDYYRTHLKGTFIIDKKGIPIRPPLFNWDNKTILYKYVIRLILFSDTLLHRAFKVKEFEEEDFEEEEDEEEEEEYQPYKPNKWYILNCMIDPLPPPHALKGPKVKEAEISLTLNTGPPGVLSKLGVPAVAQGRGGVLASVLGDSYPSIRPYLPPYPSIRPSVAKYLTATEPPSSSDWWGKPTARQWERVLGPPKKTINKTLKPTHIYDLTDDLKEDIVKKYMSGMTGGNKNKNKNKNKNNNNKNNNKKNNNNKNNNKKNNNKNNNNKNKNNNNKNKNKKKKNKTIRR